MSHSKNFLYTSCAAVIAGLVFPAQAALAQGGERALEEVVVTAQRRAESFEKVPISINSISGQALENADATRLEDISRLAPAVQIARTGIFIQPSIRGVTTVQATSAENNVAVYLDNFYQTSSMTLNMDLLNVSSVQVLKGPQGTLFGRNATGGAILVETLKPNLDNAEGKFRLGYGKFDDTRIQGYYSQPLTDSLAVNIAASDRSTDGYIEDYSGFDTAPLDSEAVYAKVLYQPSDKLQVIAGYNYSKMDDGRSLAITYGGDALALAELYFPSSEFSRERNKTSLTHPVTIRGKQNAETLTVHYDFPAATLSSYSYHQDVDTFTNYEVDGTPEVLYEQRLNNEFETYSQEFNLTSTGEGPLQYVLGLFYYDADTALVNNYTFDVVPQNSNYSEIDTLAAYADLTWKVTDRLYLTGGLRYSTEDVLSQTVSPAGDYLVDESETFHSTTPRVVARYELSDESSVYASYSEGFKSGQINTIPPFEAIEPEQIEAWEIGYKTQLDTLSLATAAYYYDYTDLQVSSILLVNGAQSATTANAASAEIYGAEANLVWAATDALQISANLAYTHARYDEFTNAPVNIPNPLGLNSNTCGDALCTQDWSGHQMVRAPDWSGNLSANYSLWFGGHTVTLSGNVAVTSSYLPNKADKALSGGGYRYEQPGYTLYSARIDWTLPGDHVTLSAYGNNLADKSYDITSTGSAFGDYHVEGQPRSYGVLAEYRF